MSPACSMLGGADPDRILAAVVGTDMRGDRIRGAPRGVAGERSCCAASPGMAGDIIRDSAATAATRRQSSSPEGRIVIGLVTRLLSYAFAVRLKVSTAEVGTHRRMPLNWNPCMCR